MFSVLAAATFSPHTRETPDLLSCCKKLSPLERHLSSSIKWKKPVVCQKYVLKCHAHNSSPSVRVLFEDIK